MTNNSQSTIDIFKELGKIFENPNAILKDLAEKATAKLTRRIVSLDFETTIDKIILIVGISLEPTGNKANMTEVIVITEDDFREWVEATEKLTLTFGTIDDPDEYQCGYYEYMTEHVGRQDFKEYIIDKNLLPNTYEWIYP